MSSPKLSRRKALEALRRLIAVRKPTLADSPLEIFPYGLIAIGPDGNLFTPAKRPKEEHRSVVLVMAALIDQVLESAIASRLPGIKPDNEGYIFTDDAAPLRDLDAKIRLGFALGIYGERARADLSLIRTIRNTFAHSRLDLHFEFPEVIEACSHLTLPSRAPTLMLSSFRDFNGDYCQVFVDVGFQYSMYLIPPGEGGPELGQLGRDVLDLPPLRT